MWAHQLIYWRNITTDIEKLVLQCAVCQELTPRKMREKLLSYPLTTVPYEHIGAGVATFEGKDYLVVVDSYLFWIDVVPWMKKDAKSIFEKLKPIFATHSIPQTMVVDNMPFNSANFKRLAKEPKLPLIVGVVKKLLSKAKATGKWFFVHVTGTS